MTEQEHLTRGALLMAQRYLQNLANAWDAGKATGFVPPGASLMVTHLALDPPSLASDTIAKAVAAQAIQLSRATPVRSPDQHHKDTRHAQRNP